MSARGRIHIIGICGTGTGALAGLLHAQGWRITGSDTAIYPPMSERLAAWGIPVMSGYDPAHLAGEVPIFVVVGNVIRANNPEAQAAEQAGLPRLSMPEAVARFGIGDRHSLVVAGTHGKTTTTALLAHVLGEVGVDPGYLIGGVPVGGRPSFHVGAGPAFVVEGDEYDTAFFDKGPKFLHYRARTCIITSLEFDHADIFADLAAVEAAFARLVAQVPKDGRLVVWRGAGCGPRLARAAAAEEVVIYDSDRLAAAGGGEAADLWLASWHTDHAGTTLAPVLRGEPLGPMRVPLWGEFAAHNALAVIAAVSGRWCEPGALAAALASFPGVRRRMEVVAEGHGIVLVDDFAHHPTAVAKTLAAARQRWPGRPLWALFEPRSATARRRLFAAEYRAAFQAASHVLVASHPRLAEVPEGQRFSPGELAADLSALGVDAAAPPTTDAMVAQVAAGVEADAVVMVLSNGDFDGIVGRLCRALSLTPAGV